MIEETKGKMSAFIITTLYYGLVFATLFDYTPVTSLMVYYVLITSLMIAIITFSVFWVKKLTSSSIADLIIDGLLSNPLKYLAPLKTASHIVVICAFVVYDIQILAIAEGTMMFISYLSTALMGSVKHELMILKLKGEIT